ncbi:MAG: thioredoxin domain-containing protein [Saprospiraceae bacterium]|nr:thioredoxin domain-containing protein [Saprospiraceae bacterium]
MITNNLSIRFSWFCLGIFFLLLSCQNKNQHSDHQHTNQLIHESSPYLLQHAHNPVNWHPWSEAALAKAKKEDKLLIISIGYSACHWCHVMEKESFEDTLVSKIMNEHFISVKVDREERPDVDDVYMTACQLASQEGCGWPLNVFALPDGRPVWAGTYFPKDNWMSILEYFKDLYQTDRQKLEDYAAQLTKSISETTEIVARQDEYTFSAERLNVLKEQFLKDFDYEWGGQQGAPKFPMPNNYEFLLAYHYQTKDEEALKAVTTTLDKLAMGGIYDHLGGGFARYSTDEFWHVPHFEKMLYDNAQLVSIYSQAFQLTQNQRYKEVVQQTLDFVERELTDESGGFYSSLDADSQGEEGRYYIWQEASVDSILQDEQSRMIFKDFYTISRKGNWEHSNILYQQKTKEEVAKRYQITTAELDQLLSQAREKLLAVRSKRPRPGLDDKILTSWNALMLKAYADAFMAFGESQYREKALNSARFLVENMMQEDGRLDRNYKNGKSSINAFLDDYALTMQAMMRLYEITFDEQWLRQAEKLGKYVMKHFDDPKTGMFFYTSDLDPPLVARKMVLSDNVIPASNSVMARALFKLGTYLYKPEYVARSKQMMHNMMPEIIESGRPPFYSNWCQLYLTLSYTPYEVAIVGPEFEARRAKMQARYLPDVIFLGGATEGSLALLKDKMVEGETIIYVCQNKVCRLPVSAVNDAYSLLE